eukprot:TRINITY_DN44720_c0_g1_i1.p1 TRINITY_DN44720_c0_g1~~TRINITY_DN44720_c0_g1_i1.p1  ORF type:complete len:338 (+),score=105.61 TRINITY_DN44720_c0_g1_i1:109-1122(+)
MFIWQFFFFFFKQKTAYEMLRSLVGSEMCIRDRPNTVPPVTNVDMAVEYHSQLKALAPEVEFFMTLYLTPELTPEIIQQAAESGIIVGVKSYPQGLTTNSESGVKDYDQFHPVFAAMEEHGLVLEIHGEVPSSDEDNICVMNAERSFLPRLFHIHESFPTLKIVLEHTTTAEAVEAVKQCGDTVGATITAHHLELCIDDVVGKAHNFCKPVAKYPRDRLALCEVIKQGHPRFFLGSDSAPHPRSKKECACACAGVFTSAYLMPYLATTFEKLGCLDKLEGFACQFGSAFYGKPAAAGKLVLVKQPNLIPDMIDPEGNQVVPFKAGESIEWAIESCEF